MFIMTFESFKQFVMFLWNSSR